MPINCADANVINQPPPPPFHLARRRNRRPRNLKTPDRWRNKLSKRIPLWRPTETPRPSGTITPPDSYVSLLLLFCCLWCCFCYCYCRWLRHDIIFSDLQWCERTWRELISNKLLGWFSESRRTQDSWQHMNNNSSKRGMTYIVM